MRQKCFILLVLFLLFAPATLGQEMPDGVYAALAPDLALLPNGTVESFCLPSQEECIVLLRDGGNELSLYSLLLENGEWNRNWGNRYLSLVTEHPVSLSVHEENFFAWHTVTLQQPGFAIKEIDENNGTPLQTFDFVKLDGRWRLIQHITSNGVYSEVLHRTDGSNRLDPGDGDSCAIFWTDERWTDLTGKIAFPHSSSSCADYMAISMLPSVYKGNYFFDLTPRFVMPETGLISVCIGRNNLKYPVYSGPGTQYHRAANGKASMASSESFGVLGKTGEWLMVIYGISDGRARVGYVRYTGDPYLEQVAAFTHESDFSHFENIFTIKKLPLWDDPVNRTNPLCTLSKNTEVIYLEDCGELAYVEVTVNGKKMRGFVENDALGNG